jgi:hypothetical protein
MTEKPYMPDSKGDTGLPDDALSSAYRSFATETTPSALDDRVLDTARRHAAVRPSHGKRTTWYRPVAFIATAGLSLALLIQLDQSGVVKPTAITEDSAEIRQLDATGNRSSSTGNPAMIAPNAPVTDAGSQIAADDHCTDEQRSESSTWWQCIDDLERRGLTQAAERELAALLNAFPGFERPGRP